MKNESLNGTLVLIDPQLENDPDKGKIAIVKYESKTDSKVYVSLENGKEIFFDVSELVKLKGMKDITASLLRPDPDIPRSAYIDLYKITLLQERGTAKAEWQALEIVQRNPDTWSTAIEPAKGPQISLDKAYSR